MKHNIKHTHKKKYQLKKKHKKKTTKKKRVKRGGNRTETIDLRQILITRPIIEAVLQHNKEANLDEFRLSKGGQGFPLNRMENIMQVDFDELLKNEPVELILARNNQGKIIGIKIDGKLMRAYEILNGRHRIARAIIDNRKTINANIFG